MLIKGIIDHKHMASEIPTHMLNLKNSIILSLKFSLCALVTCGLSYITKIFTDEILFHIIEVLSNMNSKNSLTSLPCLFQYLELVFLFI